MLASMLLPALARAKSKALAVQCLGQMRQLGLATVMYANDNDGFLPRSSHSTMAHGQLPWGYALVAYVSPKGFTAPDAMWTNLFKTLYHCPADRRQKTDWSYGKNVYPELSVEETGSPTWPRLGMIPRPTVTVIYAEKASSSMADHFMAHFWLEGGQPEVDRTRHDQKSNPQSYALWGVLFLNVTAGNLFISNAVPIMRERTGAGAATAASVYGLIALANGLGRFAWGAISDLVGRRAAWVLIYVIQTIAFLVVGRASGLWLVAALFAVVLLCYGGGFGTMPSFVADWFGTRHLGVNYGWVLLAWSAAGLAGPGFVAWVKDRTGTYAGALPVTAALLASATVLPLVARRPRPPGA